QFGARAEIGAAEQVSAFAVEVIGAGLGNRVEHGPHRIAELRRKSVADHLDVRYVDIGNRNQADAGAVALRVVAAVDLVIDASVKPIGIDLARHSELCVGPPADVGLEQNKVVRI